MHDLLISLLSDQGELIDSSIARISWAYSANVPKFPYDVDAARRLLAEAGWTAGSDGVLQTDGVRLAFTRATNSSNKERVAVATIAQDAWRKVGVDMQKFYEVISAGGANSKMFQMVMPWVLEGDDSHLKGPLRIAGKDMRFYAKLAEQAPALPIIHQQGTVGVGKKVQGVKVHPSRWLYRMLDISLS